MSSDQILQKAISEFNTMNSEKLNEAARIYLNSISDIIVDRKELQFDDIEELKNEWRKSFVNQNDMLEADSLLKSTIDNNKSDELVRIAVLSTLESFPETREQFVDSVNSAGKGLFIIELGIAIGLIAAMIIRELYAKGKKREIDRVIHRTDGTVITEKITEYSSGNSLANLLSHLATPSNNS